MYVYIYICVYIHIYIYMCMGYQALGTDQSNQNYQTLECPFGGAAPLPPQRDLLGM